jgi:hypothetical protein
MAVPLRPTIAIAVSSGPSSRTIATTMSLPISSEAPTLSSWAMVVAMVR